MPAVEPWGVSWDHPRGHDCMVATAEACKYTAIAPEVGIIPFVRFAAAAWLADGGSADGLLDQLDTVYRRSEPEGKE